MEWSQFVGRHWTVMMAPVFLMIIVFWGIILRWRTRIRGPVLAGTGRVTKVELLRPSYDQRDWYHVTVQLTIPEMPDRTVDAPPHRFEFEPNDRPVVGDIWSVEVSATDPSRYRLLDFPVRRDLSSATAKPLTHPSWVIKPIIKPPTLQAYTGGPGLDSRFGQRKVRGPMLTGTAQALIVQRITEPGGEGPDRYHYVITLRVKTPRYEPYDVIRMYRNMKKIRPFEGDAWEVQVSESDPFTLAVLFERPVPTQP